jgi:hypothetical protein
MWTPWINETSELTRGPSSYFITLRSTLKTIAFTVFGSSWIYNLLPFPIPVLSPGGRFIAKEKNTWPDITNILIIPYLFNEEIIVGSIVVRVCTCIHSVTFMHYILQSLSIPSATVSIPSVIHPLIAWGPSGKTLLGCRGENRTRAYLTEGRRTTGTIWTTPHPLTEPIRTLTDPRRTLWATPQPWNSYFEVLFWTGWCAGSPAGVRVQHCRHRAGHARGQTHLHLLPSGAPLQYGR